MRFPHLLLAPTLLFASSFSEAPASLPSGQRRYALVIGENFGGSNRVTLRYAVSDARAVAHVFTSLGGVRPEDLVLLEGPDLRGIDEAFTGLGKRIASEGRGGEQSETVFYYSGHSDEEGLCIGNGKIGYGDLRERIRALPSGVKVAILDSCASGAITRLKGGKRLAPFLVDNASRMKGHAFLTSSSVDEAAQESDRIGGSFFTHYLVSGLRGAADANRDGKVTLNESYNHAFRETLAGTEQSRGGPQHPGYDIQLSGTGDLVLTDTRTPTSTLTLPVELSGRVSVRDAGNSLVAELRKNAGAASRLALEPGLYRILVDGPEGPRTGEISLSNGQTGLLDLAAFVKAPREVTVARGASRDGRDIPSTSGNLEIEPLVFGFVPGLRFPFPKNRPTRTLVGIHAIGGADDEVVGYASSGVFTLVTGRADGFVASGVLTRAGFGTGFLTSGVLSVVSGAYRGMVASGAVTLLTGAGSGFFTGGAVTSTGAMDGAVASGAVSTIHGDLNGMIASGAFGWVGGNVRGFATSGAVTIVNGDVDGMIASGAVNIVRGRVTGFATSGLLNQSAEVYGTQIGVVNITSNIVGVQIGVVNVAHTMSGIGIGVVNLIGNGIHAPELTVDEQRMLHLALKLGSPWFYTFLDLGLRPAMDGIPRDAAGISSFDPKAAASTLRIDRVTPGAGFGFHVPVGKRLYFDFVTLAGNVMPDFDLPSWRRTRNVWSREEILVGFSIFKHLSLVAGLSYNVLADWGDPFLAANPMGAPIPELAMPWSRPFAKQWVGFKAGIRF